jgi:hypothetical protein
MSSLKETEHEVVNEKASDLGDDVLDQKLSKDDPAIDTEIRYYMSGPKLVVLTAGLCLALFLLGLDTAIVSTVSSLEEFHKLNRD